jgi:hypothetical protein
MNEESGRLPSIQATEELLYDLYGQQINIENVPSIFILGSPRTGSTLLYQLICRHFSTVYITNHTNDNYAETPSVGVALDHTLFPDPNITLESSYGKTKRPFEPSEGSAIFAHWFGGEHPSQLKSARVLPGRRQHFQRSLQTIFAISNRPLVTKNAWNVFRIQELATTLKSAIFIWIRRDIAKSALSDLEARYRRGGPEIWNSATTSNYQEIQKLPYWEQVVEQQYWYNKTISEDLEKFARGRFCEVWYEDLTSQPKDTIDNLFSFLTARYSTVTKRHSSIPAIESRSKQSLLASDFDLITTYIMNNSTKFHLFETPSK